MQITSQSIRDQIPYYLTQEAKAHLIKALDEFPSPIDYYINRYPSELLQGDGWTSVDVINFDSGEKKQIKAILLSNSCDVDPANPRELPVKLTFAPIVKLSSYIHLLSNTKLSTTQINDKVQAIKEQKITSLFYLPGGAKLNEDYIALLDDVHTVPYSAFSSQVGREKVFTLSQVGFYLFVLKLSVHFCRFHEQVDRYGDAATVA